MCRTYLSAPCGPDNKLRALNANQVASWTAATMGSQGVCLRALAGVIRCYTLKKRAHQAGETRDTRYGSSVGEASSLPLLMLAARDGPRVSYRKLVVRLSHA